MKSSLSSFTENIQDQLIQCGIQKIRQYQETILWYKYKTSILLNSMCHTYICYPKHIIITHQHMDMLADNTSVHTCQKLTHQHIHVPEGNTLAYTRARGYVTHQHTHADELYESESLSYYFNSEVT